MLRLLAAVLYVLGFGYSMAWANPQPERCLPKVIRMALGETVHEMEDVRVFGDKVSLSEIIPDSSDAVVIGFNPMGHSGPIGIF